jgi:hypothetical protein
MRPQVLFLSEQVLKDRTVINENIDPKLLKQTIWKVQEEKMLPALGSALYNRLVTGVKDNNLTNDEKELLDDYIISAMVWYVLADAPIAISVKYTNKGLQRKNAENTESLSMSDMYEIMKHYQNSAEFQKERMIRFLKANAVEGGKFKEYLQDPDSVDDIKPEKSGYTCPIVL